MFFVTLCEEFKMKEKIPISDIVLDESIYPRERIDRKRVSLFAENMRDGFSFDPIVVEHHQAIIVTGDGDFYCLVKYLMNHDKLAKVLAPSPRNCSSLLKKVAKDKIAMVCDLQKKLIYKKSTS